MLPLTELIKSYSSHFDVKNVEPLYYKEEILMDKLDKGLKAPSISKELYGDTPSNRSFKKLKASLFDKLLTGVIYSYSGDSIQKAKQKIYKNILSTRILELFGVSDVFAPLAVKLLRKCLKYHMFGDSVEIARILSRYYAVFKNDLKKGRRYHEIAMNSLLIYQKELKYDWAYSEVRYQYGKGNFEKGVDRYKELADKLYIDRKPGSLKLNYLYFDIRFFQYHAENNPEGKMDICREALQYFNELPFEHELAKNVFRFHLIDTCLEKQDLAKAELLASSFLSDTARKTQHYYRYQELLLRIKLFQGKAEEAEELYNHLMENHSRISNPFAKDRLLVYSVYLGLLKGEKVNFRKINYNLNRVSEDKKGLHVPLLVGQALYYLIHEPDKFIDKIDAVKQYAYHHLKDDMFLRTKAFIKRMEMLSEGKDSSEIGWGSAARAVKIETLEIVQYEILWNRIKETVGLQVTSSK